jgi:hypothetical protein
MLGIQIQISTLSIATYYTKLQHCRLFTTMTWMSDSTPRCSPIADGRSNTIPLHSSSACSDIDKTKDLINIAPSPIVVLHSTLLASPPCTSICLHPWCSSRASPPRARCSSCYRGAPDVSSAGPCLLWLREFERVTQLWGGALRSTVEFMLGQWQMLVK